MGCSIQSEWSEWWFVDLRDNSRKRGLENLPVVGVVDLKVEPLEVAVTARFQLARMAGIFVGVWVDRLFVVAAAVWVDLLLLHLWQCGSIWFLLWWWGLEKPIRGDGENLGRYFCCGCRRRFGSSWRNKSSFTLHSKQWIFSMVSSSNYVPY